MFSAALVLLLTACSGGGGGGAPPPPVVPEPLGAFAGDWDFSLKVTASAIPTVPIGTEQSAPLSIVVTGASASIDNMDSEGALVGTIVGKALTLRRPGDELQLTIGTNDRITGIGIFAEDDNGTPRQVRFDITGERSTGGGTAMAIAEGVWSFEVDLSGSPLFFDNGQLSQDGATVTFEVTDASTVPPTSFTWTGDLVGTRWTPTVTGLFSFVVDGDFSADGRSFLGVFESTLLGNGTITGAIEP